MPPTRQITPQQALVKLQDLCARAEHCEGEVRERLRRWAISPKSADQIVEALKSDRYVDDARFANAFVRDKVRFAHWGYNKIRQALALKRVDRQLISDAIEAFDADEYSKVLTHILQAKIKSNPDLTSTYEGRTKLYRFAISRGFESSLVTPTLRALLTAGNK